MRNGLDGTAGRGWGEGAGRRETRCSWWGGAGRGLILSSLSSFKSAAVT